MDLMSSKVSSNQYSSDFVWFTVHREFLSIVLQKPKNRPAKLRKIREFNPSGQLCEGMDEIGPMDKAGGFQAVLQAEDPGRGKLLRWWLSGAHASTSWLSLPAEAGFLPKPKLFHFWLFLCPVHILSYITPILYLTHPLLLGSSLPWSASAVPTQDDVCPFKQDCAVLYGTARRWTGTLSHLTPPLAISLQLCICIGLIEKESAEELLSSAVISLWFIPANGSNPSACKQPHKAMLVPNRMLIQKPEVANGDSRETGAQAQ